MGRLAAAYTAAFLAVLAVLAVLAARHPLRADLTATKRHTLAPETHAVLAAIPEDAPPVEIFAVLSFEAAGATPQAADAARREVEPLLALFGKGSRRVRPEIVFAEQDPQLVRSFELLGVPSFVVRWQAPLPEGTDTAEAAAAGPRIRRTDVMTEEGLRQAIKEVLEGKPRLACVLTGHGEAKLSDTGPAGLAVFAQVLAADNFEMTELLLAGEADVPAGAELVVIAGPESDLNLGELDALHRYSDRGGSILAMISPARDPQAQPELRRWLAQDWGVGLEPGVVADLDAALQGKNVMLLVPPDEGATHPIVRGFSQLIAVPVARKVAVLADFPEGVSGQTLLSAGARSWLETQVDADRPSFDEGVDARGPVPLAAAVTRKPHAAQGEARMVAIGSRHVFENMFLGDAGNAPFLRNCVAWLRHREDDIDARRGTGVDGTVVIPRLQGVVVLASVFALPAIVALAGAAIWWLRRRL
jgi:ABC-type uncharacterized transport system involved in gliding motility auxiliary subunit